MISSFSLVLPLDEVEFEYGKALDDSIVADWDEAAEEMVDTYLESMLPNPQANELVDQRTSQWVDDIRTVCRHTFIPLSVDGFF